MNMDIEFVNYKVELNKSQKCNNKVSNCFDRNFHNISSDNMGEIDYVDSDNEVVVEELEPGRYTPSVLFSTFLTIFFCKELKKSLSEDNIFDYSIYDSGETKYAKTFGPQQSLGCFSMVVMYFVNRKQEQVRKHRKSLISRNKGFKSEFRNSVRFVIRHFIKNLS